MRRILLACLLGATAGLPALASDQALPALSDAEALAVDAKLYAATYSVSEEEAMRRLLLMYGTIDQVAQIEQTQAASISGVYFDNSADFGLKVRVTDDVAPPNRRLVKRAARAERREDRAARRAERKALRAQARISDQSVEAAEELIAQEVSAEIKFIPKGKQTRAARRAKIDRERVNLKRAIPQFEMAVDDERTGETIVYVKSDDGTAKAKAEAALATAVRIEVIPTGIEPTHTRGGSRLVRTSDGALHCMTGFTARRTSDGQMGVLTAGHCLSGSPPTLSYRDRDGSNYAISPVASTVKNDSSMDIAFMTASHEAVGEFYADSTATPRAVTGTRARSTTSAATSTTTGSFVCHLGQTSPSDQTLIQSCGEVTSTSGANHNGGNTYVVVTNTQSGAGTRVTSGLGTMRCVAGDSGGPWFVYNTAFGIQSACSWYDTARTRAATVIYTSVDFASSIGVSVAR